MALVRWDPFSELLDFQRDVGRMLSRFSMPLGAERLEQGRVAFAPACDIVRQGDDLLVQCELPGVKAEDLDMSVTDSILTIRGERRYEKEVEEKNYLVRESSYGTFERRLSIPEGCPVDEIKADYHDGILEVTLPKAALITRPEKKTIPVSTEKKGLKAA